MFIDSKNEYARIIEVRKNSFIVYYEGKEVSAKLKGSFFHEQPDKLPLVGDFVALEHNPLGESVILSVEARKSLLKRPNSFKPGGMQYMAANADYCFIVTALNEDYRYNRITRYASIALDGGAVPVVILTKADLCNDIERYVNEAKTVSEGIEVHAVSAPLGIGLAELEQYFVSGVTICLMGSSGAGKSTLINSLAGEEVMKTGSVRESDGRGRHTTTHRQLIMLKNCVSIIDTPGMREIGTARNADGIEDAFSDIVELEKRCKFGNCRHESEPGCAVRAAIAAGELTERRLELYRSLEAENEYNYVKMKRIAKLQKEYKKNKYKGNL